MSDFQSKYEFLSDARKQEVDDFVEFLYEKENKTKKETFDMEAFREKLLKVSVWSDEDMKPYDELRKHWKKWKIESF